MYATMAKLKSCERLYDHQSPAKKKKREKRKEKEERQRQRRKLSYLLVYPTVLYLPA